MAGPCEHGCVRGHGGRCAARASGHRRLCALIALGRDDYAALVDRLTARGWVPPAPAEPAGDRPAPPPGGG